MSRKLIKTDIEAHIFVFTVVVRSNKRFRLENRFRWNELNKTDITSIYYNAINIWKNFCGYDQKCVAQIIGRVFNENQNQKPNFVSNYTDLT